MHKLILLFLLVLPILVSCSHQDSLRRQYAPERVSILPEGFATLDLVIEDNKEVFSLFFWSGNVVIQDLENVTIFQVSTNNPDFIVTYRGAHYINEKILSEIVDYAINLEENRSRTYHVGDIVEISNLAGYDTSYSVSITKTSLLEHSLMILRTVGMYIVNYRVECLAVHQVSFSDQMEIF